MARLKVPESIENNIKEFVELLECLVVFAEIKVHQAKIMEREIVFPVE